MAGVMTTNVVATDDSISINGDNGVRDIEAVGKVGVLLFVSGKDEETVRDSGVVLFTCVKDNEAVGDAGALVGMGVLPDGALDLKWRATMRGYGTRPNSLVWC